MSIMVHGGGGAGKTTTSGLVYHFPIDVLHSVQINSSVTERINEVNVSETLRISRKFSQRAVMEAIVQSGPISRASIAKQTGLSKQTISEIVRQLELDGWVQETGRTSGHVGRTAVTYELMPDAAYIAAVDLGGTKMRVAIADLACQVFAEEVAPTDQRGGQFVVDQIAASAGRPPAISTFRASASAWP